MKSYTKLEAVRIIIKEARASSSRLRSLKRLRRAMLALELSPQEQVEIEVALGFRHFDRRVYPWYTE